VRANDRACTSATKDCNTNKKKEGVRLLRTRSGSGDPIDPHGRRNETRGGTWYRGRYDHESPARRALARKPGGEKAEGPISLPSWIRGQAPGKRVTIVSDAEGNGGVQWRGGEIEMSIAPPIKYKS